MKGKKRYTIYIDAREMTQFKSMCALGGFSMSEVIETLIKEFNNKKIQG